MTITQGLKNLCGLEILDLTDSSINIDMADCWGMLECVFVYIYIYMCKWASTTVGLPTH
jgi:hypothetical protein